MDGCAGSGAAGDGRAELVSLPVADRTLFQAHEIDHRLGELPKRRSDSCRAWLHGKLLVALLLERLLDEAEHFSPWSYDLDAAAQPLA